MWGSSKEVDHYRPCTLAGPNFLSQKHASQGSRIKLYREQGESEKFCGLAHVFIGGNQLNLVVSPS